MPPHPYNSAVVSSECLVFQPDGFLRVGTTGHGQGVSTERCGGSQAGLSWIMNWLSETARDTSSVIVSETAANQIHCGLLGLPPDFRVAFSTTEIFEGGMYQFTERFRDSAVVFIDGKRIRESGCREAFDSRCTETMFELAISEGAHVIAVELTSTYRSQPLAELSWERMRTGVCDVDAEQWKPTTSAHPTWVDAKAHGQIWGNTLDANHVMGDDDSFVAVIPFDFPFFGGTKRSTRINANGYLTFSGEHHGYGNTVPIPNTAHPNDLIAVFWTDLNPEREMHNSTGMYHGKIYTYAPPDNSMFVIQWDQMPFFDTCEDSLRFGETCAEHNSACACNTDVATFQCVLYPTGAVKMNYLNAPSTPNEQYSSVSIGLEDASGQHGFKVSYSNAAFPGDQKTITVSDSCDTASCGNSSWLVEIFADTSFDEKTATYHPLEFSEVIP